MTTKDQIALAELYMENVSTDRQWFDPPWDDDDNHIKLSGSFEDTELYQELEQDREYLQYLLKGIDGNSGNDYGYRDELIDRYHKLIMPYRDKIKQIPNNFLDSDYYIRYFNNLKY